MRYIGLLVLVLSCSIVQVYGCGGGKGKSGPPASSPPKPKVDLHKSDSHKPENHKPEPHKDTPEPHKDKPEAKRPNIVKTISLTATAIRTMQGKAGQKKDGEVQKKVHKFGKRPPCGCIDKSWESRSKSFFAGKSSKSKKFDDNVWKQKVDNFKDIVNTFATDKAAFDVTTLVELRKWMESLSENAISNKEFQLFITNFYTSHHIVPNTVDTQNLTLVQAGGVVTKETTTTTTTTTHTIPQATTLETTDTIVTAPSVSTTTETTMLESSSNDDAATTETTEVSSEDTKVSSESEKVANETTIEAATETIEASGSSSSSSAHEAVVASEVVETGDSA